MNARYYDPVFVRRFVSADAIVPGPEDPQSYNRYAYVRNDPINRVDPSGHADLHCAGGECGFTGNTWIGQWLGFPQNAEEANRNFANIIAMIPYLDTGEDFLVLTTACGYACQAGYEEPVGTGWRIVAGVGIILPVGVRAVRTVSGWIDEGIELLQSGRTSGRVIERTLDFIDDAGERLARSLDDVLGLCSFSADTMVMSEEGPVPISEVEADTLVLAYDEETGEIGYYPVIAVWEHLDPVIVTLTVDGESLETTPEHPLYTAEGEWLAAAELQIGDEVRTAGWDTGTVEAIHFTVAPQPMYNFTVSQRRDFNAFNQL